MRTRRCYYIVSLCLPYIYIIAQICGTVKSFFGLGLGALPPRLRPLVWYTISLLLVCISFVLYLYYNLFFYLLLNRSA